MADYLKWYTEYRQMVNYMTYIMTRTMSVKRLFNIIVKSADSGIKLLTIDDFSDRWIDPYVYEDEHMEGYVHIAGNGKMDYDIVKTGWIDVFEIIRHTMESDLAKLGIKISLNDIKLEKMTYSRSEVLLPEVMRINIFKK